MRGALIVGIDEYDNDNIYDLPSCVADATRLRNILGRNADGSPNFDCLLMVSKNTKITRSKLRQSIDDLFKRDLEMALFYFSGHGTENNLGGYIVTQDVASYDEGVAVKDILDLAVKSKARERIIILDSCYSGNMGNVATSNNAALLNEGLSIITSSRGYEVSKATDAGSIFTTLIIDALSGSARDVIGNVTVASMYAYVDNALGAFDQRPMFKTHVSKLSPVRKCAPVVGLNILRSLPDYFTTKESEFAMDPSFEFTDEKANPTNVSIFNDFKKLRNATLIEPVGVEDLFFAAVNSKSVRLTPLGKYYWDLAKRYKI